MTPGAGQAASPSRCTVDEYLAGVLATLSPLDGQLVPLGEALGRVLSAPVHAGQSVPLFDNSAMDGYAVRATDVSGSSREHPARLVVVGSALAGSSARVVVGRGEAVRIMTGAPVPAGADCVIPVESSSDGRFGDEPLVDQVLVDQVLVGPVHVDLWASAKTHIRREGEDIARGARLLEPGHTLGARDIGLIAATGHVAVLAHRRPRVAVISTGDELRAATHRFDGCIPDSNSLYLAAAARSVGAEHSVSLVAPDDQDALERILDLAAADADLIVSSGGLGAGSHDLVRRTIVAAAAQGVAARVASVDMKPGRPQGHGSWGGVPWIALPGNPTAAFVSFEAFVRPALDRLSGRAPSAPSEPQTVATGWSAPAGSVRFVPLTRGGDASVSPAANPKGAGHSIAAMFAAPLIGMVGAEVEHVRPGDLLTVFAPA